MRKLYETREVLFAVLWIVAYCLCMAPIKGSFGYASIWMLLVLLVFTAGILAFVKRNKLEGKYGLLGWPRDAKRYLYFIPIWVLATGNLWDGIALSYQGKEQAIAVLSMIMIGFVEEMLFRGFLFKAMLSEEKTSVAIIVSSVTFGIGHIINLFAGQASVDTVFQVIFAVSWGFLFTMVYYKCENLYPCIIAHAMVDAFSLFGRDDGLGDMIYIGATIVVAIVYCIYLGRLEKDTV